MKLIRPDADSGLLTPRAAAFAMDCWSGQLEQAPIEVHHIAADSSAGEFLFDHFATSPPETPSQFGIACEASDGIGERLGIVERHQKSVNLRTRNDPAARHVGRDDRPS